MGVNRGCARQVILMAGLQGVGKTTACGKLALALQKRNKRVLMVATDVYRPAAIDQLVKLGERIQVPPHLCYRHRCCLVRGCGPCLAELFPNRACFGS